MKRQKVEVVDLQDSDSESNAKAHVVDEDIQIVCEIPPDPFATSLLPREVLLHVFSFLEFNQQVTCLRLCRDAAIVRASVTEVRIAPSRNKGPLRPSPHQISWLFRTFSATSIAKFKHVSWADQDVISHVATRWSKITKLVLSDCVRMRPSRGMMGVECLSELQSLNISGWSDFTSTDLVHLATLTKLTHLNIGRTSVTSPWPRLLQLTTLRSLGMRDVHLSTMHLSELLLALTQLKDLDIRYKPVGAASAQEVWLDFKQVSPSAAARLSSLRGLKLATRSAALQPLLFSGVRRLVLDTLAPTMPLNSLADSKLPLEYLGLPIEITVPHAMHALAKITSLTQIKMGISSNQSVLESLLHLTSLIALRRVTVKGGTMEPIVTWLSELPLLSAFSLVGGWDRGPLPMLSPWTAKLPSMPALTSIKIHHHNVADDLFSEICAKSPSLSSVSIHDCPNLKPEWKYLSPAWPPPVVVIEDDETQ